MNGHEIARQMLDQAAAAKTQLQLEADCRASQEAELVRIQAEMANTWPAKLEEFKQAFEALAEEANTALRQELNVANLSVAMHIRDAKTPFMGLHTGIIEQGNKKVGYLLEGGQSQPDKMTLSLYQGMRDRLIRSVVNQYGPTCQFFLKLQKQDDGTFVASWVDQDQTPVEITIIAQSAMRLLIAQHG